jgi:DNA-binding transcriptional LysR family regulator
MDRFDSMRVFAAIVEEGGLSAAARKLHLPVSTVSRKMNELEAHLGARLLTRSTRSVAPTRIGEQFHIDCRRILDELEDAEKAAAHETGVPRGALTLTAPLVFGRLHAAPLLAEFLVAYPEINATLILSDSILDLREQRIDLAIRIGSLPSNALKAQSVGEVRWIACASPAYVQAHGMPRHPRDLLSHATISFTNFRQPEVWTFRENGSALRAAIRPRLMVTSAEAAIAAALSGLGITFSLSYQVADALADGDLVELLGVFAPKPVQVSLVHAEGLRMPSKLRAFLDFAAPRLRAALAAI